MVGRADRGRQDFRLEAVVVVDVLDVADQLHDAAVQFVVPGVGHQEGRGAGHERERRFRNGCA